MGRQMRTQRGVPLTAEQRGEGGNLAQSGYGAGGFGANPDVGQFGGGAAPGTPGSQWGNQEQFGNFGQFGSLGQMFQALMQRYQPQEDVSSILETKQRLKDPARYAQQNYQARLASDPWGPGGQFENAYHLTPTAALASQGNNATNQWAQRGGVTYGGENIDPEELKKFNAVASAGRYKTYM